MRPLRTCAQIFPATRLAGFDPQLLHFRLSKTFVLFIPSSCRPVRPLRTCAHTIPAARLATGLSSAAKRRNRSSLGQRPSWPSWRRPVRPLRSCAHIIPAARLDAGLSSAAKRRNRSSLGQRPRQTDARPGKPCKGGMVQAISPLQGLPNPLPVSLGRCPRLAQ